MRITIILLLLTIGISCSNKKSNYEYSDLSNHLFHAENFLQHAYITENIISKLEADSLKYSEILYLHKYTTQLLEAIEELQTSLIEATGGYDWDGGYIDPENTEMVKTVLIESNNASILKSNLINFSSHLEELGIKNASIAIDPSTYHLLKYDQSYKDLSFEQLHFHDVTLYEAFSTLELYKALIMFKESNAMVTARVEGAGFCHTGKSSLFLTWLKKGSDENRRFS